MKKNFVKYFGVASTTLLAVAPVATPALMTASNLAVVKAGVQDDINAAFKTDNSLVQLTADQWKGLTSTVVSEKPTTPTGEKHPATQSYLDKLYAQASAAKAKFTDDMLASFDSYYNDNASEVYLGDGATVPTGQLMGVRTWLNQVSQSSISSATGQVLVKPIASGDGQDASTIGEVTQPIAINDWYGQIKNHRDSDEIDWSTNFVFPDSLSPNGISSADTFSKIDARSALSKAINSLPVWWFVQKGSTANASFLPMDIVATDTFSSIFNSKSKVFKSLDPSQTDTAGNGLVAVADNGGTNKNKMSYVGDNLVDLQKRTNNELLNLLPSENTGKSKNQEEYSGEKYQFKVNGASVTTERSAKEGSKVWSTILQSVLSPQNAKYSLKDLTSTNIVKTKMLVNGKDADKNQFITKDEIQNADRISIQFIFKGSDNSEYKSPTIWLTHGNKFTVNTSGLGNITRLPGDYYQPSAGITGIVNDTGLPMDTKKFVVVPAGTDLAYYTDKDGKVDLSALAALQGGILGTNGVAVNRGWTTAFEGGKLGASEYWTDPNYFYSKFGSYSDAVDVYYIDGTASTSKSQNVVAKTRAENRSEAAAAVAKDLKAKIVDDKTLKGDIDNSKLWTTVNAAAGDYLAENKTIAAGALNITGTTLGDMFPVNTHTNGRNSVLKLQNKQLKSDSTTHDPSVFTSNGTDSGTVIYSDVNIAELFSDAIGKLPLDTFKEVKEEVPGSTVTISASQLTKLVANAGRTTKVDVPSKYLPQVSFNDYSNKGATYYANGSTIDNWFNYSWKADSAAPSNNDPYYPAGGVIVTGGNSTSGSSSAAKQPVGYLAPASFAANSINADQLQARVNDNIQKYLTAKLTNPNTQNDSKVNGYFKGYSSGDAAYAYIKNGAVPASDLKVDTSKVDVTKPGTYYVEVTYAPLSSIKSNTVDGALGATNGNVAITDANGNVFENGSLTSNKFIDYSKTDKVPATASTTTTTAGASSSLTSFAADQIFANGAPATYKLKVQITDGSSVPESGAPVIAFTEGGQNLKIAKGGTFDQFKGLQFYAYPGAKAWDQKDDSVKVSVSGKVNTNVEGTYTLVYTVTNKAGKTSTLTRVITVGSGVEKPTEYDFNLSEAYIDYVPGYNVREYSYPGNDWTGNQVKHGTDVKVTKRAVFQNGEEWYKLGDGNWVKSQYVKAGKNPSDAVDARGVVTVNYIPGYGIAVYKEAGKPELVRVNGKAKRLPHGTAWKSFKKQKVNGITYYNVGGNQWVDGRYVDFK